jgi:putative transposase
MPPSIGGLCDNRTTTGDDRPGRHVLSALNVQLGLVTTSRRGVLTGEHLDTLREAFASVCADVGDTLVELHGENGHVHLLLRILLGSPPQVTIARLVSSLKGLSARRLRQRDRVRTHREHLWSPPSVAASAGAAARWRRSSYPSVSSALLADRAHLAALNGGACAREIQVSQASRLWPPACPDR